MNSGAFINYGNLSGNGWQFTVDSSTINQRRTLITWHLDIDTSFVTSGAGKNLNIRAFVEDKAQTSSRRALRPPC